jgi:hypothetical protein
MALQFHQSAFHAALQQQQQQQQQSQHQLVTSTSGYLPGDQIYLTTATLPTGQTAVGLQPSAVAAGRKVGRRCPWLSQTFVFRKLTSHLLLLCVATVAVVYHNRFYHRQARQNDK